MQYYIQKATTNSGLPIKNLFLYSQYLRNDQNKWFKFTLNNYFSSFFTASGEFYYKKYQYGTVILNGRDVQVQDNIYSNVVQSVLGNYYTTGQNVYKTGLLLITGDKAPIKTVLREALYNGKSCMLNSNVTSVEEAKRVLENELESFATNNYTYGMIIEYFDDTQIYGANIYIRFKINDSYESGVRSNIYTRFANDLNQIFGNFGSETNYSRNSVSSGVPNIDSSLWIDISNYTITVTQTEYGTCTVDKTEAAENDTVRVTVKPNLGQKLYNLLVVGDSVGTVSVQTESENVYTFTMPADNVKVSAIFMSNDAYVPAGEDAENLGGGDYSDISDPVPIPSVPTISASNIGMVTLFRPSLQNIMDLGNYLYTQWWNLEDNFKKWLSNPIEAMIGFNIVPCIPAVGTERVVKLGIVSSGVSMPPVNSQWYDFDCGTIDIKPYTGTMLDYAPNTKIQIMLPFIGSSALDTDEVMNKTIGLTYRIDLLSGACVAMLTINGDVRYQWTGECAVNIPFSASDFSRVYGAVLGAVGAGVTGFMAAGAAGVAAQAGASAATTQAMNNNIVASKAFKEAIGDVAKGSRGAPALRQQLKEASANAMQKAMAEAGSSNNIAGSIKAAQIARTVNNVVGQVMSAKGGVAHSGTISGAAGMLGVRTPYVIIEYPNQSLPENYRHFVGYPSNITAKLGDLKGYTECEQLIANGIKGTDNEYTELVEALKGGVYL